MAIHITRIHLEGFRRFDSFDLELNPTFNILVGDNETGKSSILEAISIVLSRQYNRRTLEYSLDPYLFNATMVANYFEGLRNNGNVSPPQVLIEAYLNDDPTLASLKGRNNTKNEDCPGLKLAIEVDGDHVDALKDYARDRANPAVLPVEFYRTTWRSFADNGITLRNLPFRAKTIDTSLPRAYRGPNRYVAQLVDDVLTEGQRRELSLAYRKLRHGFSQELGVKAINEHLENRGSSATSKKLTVQMDMSPRSTWDSAITAHLDDLPFDCAGKGEQCRVQLRLAIADAHKSRVLLIEEPENHLAHANLNMLMDDIQRDCADRQVIVATHSAFVLNKLGIDNLRLISRNGQTMMLTNVASDTKDYFMKLAGYDTLRLILSQRCILVEGPSDELIVQRAYKDKHGKLPLEAGVDVISVAGLAFKRFLEIAALLKLDVSVVTDNDGNVAALKSKYEGYMNGEYPTIRICYDDDEQYHTLEPQLLKANSLVLLNKILGTKHADNDALLKFMDANKTDYALKMFKTTQSWTAPEYIADAIK
ncbi:MAG: AAA family ATPase [Nitrospiraceae bacterium]|nr:AAA family ATPase [Nitrospiraceae bacterium]